MRVIPAVISTLGAALLASLSSVAPLEAQRTDSWDDVFARADSIGPETPEWAPVRQISCGDGVQRTDSVRVTRIDEEFTLSWRSLRTRGYFSSARVPVTGSATFALREVFCDENGRPLSFTVERDHRYFYLVFSLRELPSFHEIEFLVAPGQWRRFRWDPGRRRFGV